MTVAYKEDKLDDLGNYSKRRGGVNRDDKLDNLGNYSKRRGGVNKEEEDDDNVVEKIVAT